MNTNALLSRAVASLGGAPKRRPAGSIPLSEEEALALARLFEEELRATEQPALDLRRLPLTQTNKGSSGGVDK